VLKPMKASPKCRSKSGAHNLCFRCHQRSDNCRFRGCLPYEWHLQMPKIAQVAKTLRKLDSLEVPRRTASDCDDVEIMSQWSAGTIATYSFRVAILGCLIVAHFGNNLRTFGYIASSLCKNISWVKLHRGLKLCLKTHNALHSPNCMPGQSFREVDAKDPTARYVHGSKDIYYHRCFVNACTLMQAGIATFEEYDELYEHFKHVDSDIRGSFPGYHFKVFLDHIVGGGIVRKSVVSRWPVAPSSGTGKGLCVLYGLKSAGENDLSKMLNELCHRLRSNGCLFHTDFQGSIGAALRWMKRLSGDGSRYSPPA
jgi:hypothetical protein